MTLRARRRSPPMDPLTLLPHQAPIRVLDRVVSLDPSEAVAEQDVADPAHLRGEELWEGALIEGLAQTAALLAAAGPAAGDEPRPVRGMLVALRALELSRLPRRGETVRYVIRPQTRLGGAILVRGEAAVGDEVVARGRLQFVVEPAS